MRKLSELQKKLFIVGFMLVGFFFIVAGVIGLKQADTFSKTTAVIKSIELIYQATNSEESDEYEVMVEYTVDGKTYLSDLGVMQEDFEVGKEIEILYNPEHPEGITLPGKTSSAISIAVGVLAVAVPLFLFVRKRVAG